MTDLIQKTLTACQVNPINKIPYKEQLQALKKKINKLKIYLNSGMRFINICLNVMDISITVLFIQQLNKLWN